MKLEKASYINTKAIDINAIENILESYQADKGELNAKAITYHLYQEAQQHWIVFEQGLEFPEFLFMNVDMLELAIKSEGHSAGYINTNFDYLITRHLGNKRVCLQLNEDTREAIELFEGHLDLVDIVTIDHKHYSIDIDTLESYAYQDKKLSAYSENPRIPNTAKLIKTDEVFFVPDNYEEQFLEDYQRSNN